MGQAQQLRRTDKEDLLGLSFDTTMMGLILTLVLVASDGKITGAHVVSICIFLAAMFVWKLIWPVRRITRYFAWQVFAIAMCGMFAWWLIYQAENTRAGWYRVNVLQRRVQSFVRNSPAYVIIANGDGNITSTSDNIKLLTGYSPDELVGQPATVLMRDAPASKHLIAFQKAVGILRMGDSPDSGWTLQGIITVGLKRKDGRIVPVKIYAGGIRWSTDIQFSGDIDMFAVFIPSSEDEATGRESTITPEDDIHIVPQAPPVRPLATQPAPVPLPPPATQPITSSPKHR